LKKTKLPLEIPLNKSVQSRKKFQPFWTCKEFFFTIVLFFCTSFFWKSEKKHKKIKKNMTIFQTIKILLKMKIFNLKLLKHKLLKIIQI
jgi:hypothetical protein